MNFGIIIQSRMGSNRLPGKSLLPIQNRPVLGHVVNRAARSELIDNIVVATTTNPIDDAIETFCNEKEILVFRGSENDVLDRYYQCAKKFKMTNIIRITGDCPLIDAIIVDQTIEKYSKEDCDYASNMLDNPFPDGFNCEIFSFEALEYSWEHAILPSEKEHVTPFIKKNERFKKVNLPNETYKIYHLSLDYPEDYIVIKEIFKGIGNDFFSINDVYGFLDKNPEVLNINKHVQIDEGYHKSLKEDIEFLESEDEK